MGVKLHSAFLEAGIPAPSMSLEAGIWGGDDNPAVMMVTDVVRTLLPAIEKFGIAAEAQVEMCSLQERVQREIAAGNSVAISPSVVGAWARVG